MYIDTSVRPQGEKQQVGKLKLSEAIRIGGRIRPQCANLLFSKGKSCAMGAAYEAHFGHPGYDAYWSNRDYRFNEIFGNKLYKIYPGLPFSEITSRNDRGESRESIADWLEAQGL